MTSLQDLSLFNLNTNLDVNLNPYENLSINQIRSRYFSPHSFAQMQSKLSTNERLSSFSIFHNNVLSISKNLENLQTQILEELEFHFDIIGISDHETKITNSNSVISGYNFEFVPTPLASGGVALFIDDRHGYRILEKASNEAFQALWVEISFVKKKNIICGVVYRQHNSPERFQKYFEETIEKFAALGKQICVLGDFNIDLLKAQSSNYSHDFLLTLQSCYLIPTVDKPTRVRSTSATLIDNIFVNIPEQVLVSGNIISHISDHFSQFCILSSIVDQPKENRKVRDFSKFSSRSFVADLTQVDWDEIIARGTDDINKIFSSFYNKLNKIVNKHAPFKSMSKPWITKGIRTSIRIKNRFYMSGDHAQYKSYRNTISKLTRINKKKYYSQFFNNNLKNMQKTWEGINTLLNSKKKTSMKIICLKQPNSNTTTNMKSRIPNIMNEHFTGIGPTLANNLPTPKELFTEFPDKSKSPATSFFFCPISPNEVKLEILSV